MTQDGSKSLTLIAIVTALFFVMATNSGATTALASKKAAAPPDGPASLQFRITEGKLTGSFEDWPLVEVLEAIRGQEHFAYQVKKKLLNHPLSGEFDGVPLIQALEDLLEPFNYTMTLDADGRIERLHISSLQHGSQEGVTPMATIHPEETGWDIDVVTAAPGAEVTEEERLLFETIDHEINPPNEWFDLFEPWHDDGSEEFGPWIPPALVVEDLPEFEVIENDIGPVHPDLVVKDLPEFEPIVSKTGPSLEVLEQDELSPEFPS